MASVNVFADDFVHYWNQSQTVEYFEGYKNVINENVVLTPAVDTGIAIIDSMIIENYGTIDGNLYTIVENVSINNMGNINGMVTAPFVTQVINSETGVTAFDVNSLNFSVIVENVNPGADFNHGINLTQLRNLEADTFYINDSAIIIDNYLDWQNWDTDVFLSDAGITTLIINDSSNITSGEIINHVTNAENVVIVLKDLDDLYTVNLVGQNEVILNIIRETNYSNIPQFNNDVGEILNEIQNSVSGDALANSLNNAENIHDLQQVMNLSYRFNPSILMRPIRVINGFSLIGSLFDDGESGMKLKPEYIWSKETKSIGPNLYLNKTYKDFAVGIGLVFNRFNYINEFNNFSGYVYGGNLNFKKYIDKFWINGLIGGSLISFKTDSISLNGNIKNNPYGYSVYGGIDGGYNYDVLVDGFSIIPIVGMTFEHIYVLNSSDTNLNVRMGGDAKYSFTMDGIKYEYSVAGIVNSYADLIGMAKVGFISVSDGVGITLGIDTIKSTDYTAYKMSVDGKIIF